MLTNNNDINQSLLESMNIIAQSIKESFPFNIIEGVIQKINNNNTASVLINGKTTTIYNTSGATFNKGDVVIILKITSNSQSYILFKKGTIVL